MTIEERLERLERENRRLKYLLFSLLFLIAGVFFMGATTKKVSSIPEEIKAHKFTLVDEKGKGRAVLFMAKEAPSLAFYDEEGHLEVVLRGGKRIPGLDFFDEKGNLKASLGITEGEPSLLLRGVRVPF